METSSLANEHTNVRKTPVEDGEEAGVHGERLADGDDGTAWFDDRRFGEIRCYHDLQFDE